jgi:hypothetical protein
MPEHLSHGDRPTIVGFCSSKTTREQFRGLQALSPLGEHPRKRKRRHAGRRRSGRYPRGQPRASIVRPNLSSAEFSRPLGRSTVLLPGHPSSLPGLFDRSGSTIASSGQPSSSPRPFSGPSRGAGAFVRCPVRSVHGAPHRLPVGAPGAASREGTFFARAREESSTDLLPTSGSTPAPETCSVVRAAVPHRLLRLQQPKVPA